MTERIIDWYLVSRVIVTALGVLIALIGHSSLIVAILGATVAVFGLGGSGKMHVYFGGLFKSWLSPYIPQRKNDVR